MRTVVLDDDPTGTQSATGVTVLLEYDASILTEALRDAPSVYVQTNSRALVEPEAVALVTRVRDAALVAGRTLGEEIQFVLRGDSTLRGHVFAESAVFASSGSVLLFVPAFPDGGRTTRGGIHYARIDGRDVPAGETEYAEDPVFGFRNSSMTGYVAEKNGQASTHVALEAVRTGGLAGVLSEAPEGRVVTCDAVTGDDIALIADAVRAVRAAGRPVVVRSAAPLAADLAGVASSGLLPTPLVPSVRPTLLVCGSHTAGATAQLEALEPTFGSPVEVDTAEALRDPASAGRRAAARARERLRDAGQRTSPARRAQHTRPRREGDDCSDNGGRRTRRRRGGGGRQGRDHVLGSGPDGPGRCIRAGSGAGPAGDLGVGHRAAAGSASAVRRRARERGRAGDSRRGSAGRPGRGRRTGERAGLSIGRARVLVSARWSIVAPCRRAARSGWA